jgi:hypothetical protein
VIISSPNDFAIPKPKSEAKNTGEKISIFITVNNFEGKFIHNIIYLNKIKLKILTNNFNKAILMFCEIIKTIIIKSTDAVKIIIESTNS